MAQAAEALRVLQAGAAIVAPVLAPGGFTFEITGTGASSRGGYGSGRLTRPDQYLEFHVRHSLGLVTYGWDSHVLSHKDYLRGVGASGAYPGYSSDILDGCRHLAADLAGPLSGLKDRDRTGYELGLRAAKQEPADRLP